MANTTIQLKYSTQTATPTSLNVAEPAYSYTSNTLFIGSPDGTGSLAIGGKFYVDQQGLIFTKTNVAFDAANSAGSYANAAFAVANTALLSTGAYAHANAAFLQANSAFTVANNAVTSTNGAIAWATANSAASYANSAFLAANTPSHVANSAASYANSAFSHANAAFTSSNTKFSSSGGTVSGDVGITGNLTVSGTTTYINTDILTVEDSLIKLANNNTVGDVVDIGFYGTYNSSGQKYTGLARTAGTNNFFLFKGLTADPSANALASGSVTAANAATLIANVTAYSVTINGQDIDQFATNAYTQANTAVANALAGSTAANAAFGVANTTSAAATSAGSYANSAFATANNSAGVNLTQNASITAAFTAANSAGVYANSAFAAANTDYTNLTITAADYGTASAVAAFKVEANGRISSANSTSIAIAASQITSGELGVTRGGTGAGTFTNNGVLLGQGTSAFSTASSSTEGHVLTINASGVPTFSHLQGGTF